MDYLNSEHFYRVNSGIAQELGALGEESIIYCCV